MTIRRIVTGEPDPSGPQFVSDELVPATVFSGSGHTFHQLWGADEPRSLPDDGARPAVSGPVPLAGGYRVGIFTVSPDATADAPGMHATATTDIVVVLSGEVDLELPAGVARTVRAGDTVVQNATTHRWVNRSGQAAQLAVFSIGANPRP